MKASLRLFVICIFSMLVLSCKPASRLEAKLEELDAVINDQKYLEEKFWAQNDLIRLAFTEATDDSLKWEACYSLFYRYSHWDTDSTLLYLNNMTSLSFDNQDIESRNKVCRALSFSVSGNKEKALIQLSNVNPQNVGDSFIPRYFLLGNEILENLDEAQNRLDLLYEAIQWKDKLNYSEIQFINAELELSTSNDDSAMSYFYDAFKTSESESLKSRCAFKIALIYENWEDYNLMKYWMAEASICGIKAHTRDTEALYNLALVLFKDKDLDRASKYIHQIIENSVHIGQNAQLIISSLDTQQAISDALDFNESMRISVLAVASSILGIMLIFILILLANTQKDRKRISQSKQALADTNKQLQDSNLIKENFMFRYMQMSINYLAAVEEYRHSLRKTLREEGVEALKVMLRKPMGSGENYDEFYKIFDENFLKLYPNFVRNINTLLPEEDRFDPNQQDFSTQLRILATIRLGLTDSGQIAKFLNCASSSVYSYRSRLKHKAICKSEQFEELIKTFN